MHITSFGIKYSNWWKYNAIVKKIKIFENLHIISCAPGFTGNPTVPGGSCVDSKLASLLILILHELHNIVALKILYNITFDAFVLLNIKYWCLKDVNINFKMRIIVINVKGNYIQF